MSGANNQQWGMTPPISLELPTSDEIKLNDALMDELKNQSNFESTEATSRRQEVLRHFQRVTEAFVKHVAEKRKLATSVIENGGGKVATFGSYRLGVFGPGRHSQARQTNKYQFLTDHIRFGYRHSCRSTKIRHPR
jgi:poly(A) polymerase